MFENPQKNSRNAIFQGDFQALCIPSFFTFFQSVFVRLINKGRQRIEGGKFTDVEKKLRGIYMRQKRGRRSFLFVTRYNSSHRECRIVGPGDWPSLLRESERVSLNITSPCSALLSPWKSTVVEI